MFSVDGKSERTCTVCIEVTDTQNNQSADVQYTIGNVKVTDVMTWSELEEHLSNLWLVHIGDVTTGLRTKKTIKFDHIGASETAEAFTLGLSQNSIRNYSIGM